MKRRSAAASADARPGALVRQHRIVSFAERGAAVVEFDFHLPRMSRTERRAWGKSLREKCPREAHARWTPPKNRPNPWELIARSNRGRLPDLIPLRMGRMLASPLGFLRGSAGLMASDLALTPATGITVIIDGDAHLGNFGLYGTPQRDIVFDLNDFDEVIIGPWEWDLKRLVVSVNVAGRENGLNKEERAVAVRRAVVGYRTNLTDIQPLSLVELWYRHTYPGRRGTRYEITDAKTAAIFEKAIRKAERTTNATLLVKAGERSVNGAWRLREDPPILSHVSDELREKIINGLNAYSETLPREFRTLVNQYHVTDVVRRVVGVGSVGTRAYLVLLFGLGDDDPLFLQVKEATEPALGPYLPPLPEEFRHDGWRVVLGTKILQASHDLLLGHTTIEGRSFYVRQMKNMKGSIPVEWLTGEPFNYYAWLCGSLLARAHGRTGNAAALAGYCGGSGVLDDALAIFAERYAAQNQRDFEAFQAAVRARKIEVIEGI